MEFVGYLIWGSIFFIALALTRWLTKWYRANEHTNYKRLRLTLIITNLIIIGSFFFPWVIKQGVVYRGIELILLGWTTTIITFFTYLIATVILIARNSNKTNWLSFGIAFIGIVAHSVEINNEFNGLLGSVIKRGYNDLTFIPAFLIFFLIFSFIFYSFILDWRPKNKWLRDLINLKDI
ncbi:MAG: hypothetical protein HYT64_00795 [Candidatus Yanofskybacteria bacterium]|nr:hypothetical protein [Candidatus Yanofskybacteria bacterium]